MTALSPEPYVYRKLDPSRREIRLFHIDPNTASPSDLVTGTITHVSLDEKFDCEADTCYDTMSYAWGSLELSEKILIDGRVLPVTLSAWNALASMCLEEEIRRVWIDSVCINQTDLEERAQQVLLMRQIYRAGCINVIHLGSSDRPGTAKALENIQAIYEEIRAETNNFANFESYIMGKAEDGGEYWKTSQTPLVTKLAVDALIGFFSKRWFQRMWVVQEAVLANENECFFGEHEVELRVIMRVAVWLYHKRAFVPEALLNHNGVLNTLSLWYLEEYHNPLKHGDLGLITLMDFTFRRESSELRDKVYGILGLSTYLVKERKVPELLQPDYTKPIDRIRQDVTRFIIRERKDLLFLRFISHDIDVGPLPGVCSWCTPLTPWPQDGSALASLPFNYRGIIPSSNALSEEDALLCTEDPGTLHLSGVQIGTLAQVSKCSPWKPRDLSPGFDIALAELVTWASTLNSPMRSNHFRRILARTLTVGVNLQEIPATEQEIDLYEDVLSLLLDEYGRPKHSENGSSSATPEVHQSSLLLMMRTWSISRRLFSTMAGMFGLGPGTLRQGDLVVAVNGCKWPVVLRQIEESSNFQMLGVAYIDSIMNGEAAEKYEKASDLYTTFIIQ